MDMTREQLLDSIYHLVEREKNHLSAELLLDEYAGEKITLARDWNVSTGYVYRFISTLYCNIAGGYQQVAAYAERNYNTEDMIAAAKEAERVYEKALNVYGVSPEDVLYLPSTYDFRNFVTIFSGLGAINYALKKTAESQRYLELCLNLPGQDEKAKRLLQSARQLYDRVVG